MGGKTSAFRQKSRRDTRKSVLQCVKKSNVCLQGTQRRLAEKKVKSESGISVLNCMGHHSRTLLFSKDGSQLVANFEGGVKIFDVIAHP